MTEEQFHDSVLKGVHTLDEKIDRVESANEILLKNYDQLGKETRRAMEDMTHLKNTANDHARILQSIQKLQSCLRTEARATGLDPIQRWSQDERKRGLFNAAVRSTMCDNDSEYKRFVAPILKAIGEDSGEGSTMIVAQLFREIYDTLAQYGDWSTLGVRRLGTKVTNFPVKTARVVANWITTEASPISDDANEVGTTLTLTVLPNAVLLNVSRQLIEDSEFDVTAIVMEDFQQAFNLRLDTAAFVGSGTGANTASDGGFTGLFTGGTPATAAAGNTTVESLDFEDILRCLTTVAPIVLKRKPCWWIHPQVLARMMAVKDHNGRPIFLGALEAPSYGAIGTILGYPVIPVMAAPNTDAAGSAVAAFGDRNGQVVGIRDDFVFEASDHYRWNTLERSFRAYGRAATGTRRADAFSILTTAQR